VGKHAVSNILEVCRLEVAYPNAETHQSLALSEIDIELPSQTIVGILGESGSGKTTLAKSILRLLPHGTHVSGAIRYHDQQLLQLKPSALQQVRGRKISIIHQDPASSLHPLIKAGPQVSEVLRSHFKKSNSEVRQRVLETLERVQLRSLDRIYDSYPHQLSGGERLRVAIAQAIVCNPELIIADEPTSSLDGGVQAEILELFQNLNRTLGTGILLISHNPGVLAAVADRIVIMRSGRIVETGTLREVLEQPQHQYTKDLVDMIASTYGLYPQRAGEAPRG
jgi:ABC-type glutathione transport system ATPase component